MVSMPAWCSRIRPAKNPPSVEELAARMKRELQPLENECRDACKRIPNCCELAYCCDFCGQVDYDPERLLPPEMTESLEFEIAPGETVLFITLRRRYPCSVNKPDETPFAKNQRDLCFSSNWHTIVRENGLEPLWSLGWAYWHEKADDTSCVMGAADVDGDGVSEVVIGRNGFENEFYDLYQYKDKKLVKLLDVSYGY